MRRRVPALGTALRCCCLLAWLAAGVPLAAQAGGPAVRPAAFLEVTHPRSAEDSDRYGEVISQLVRATLYDAGLETVEPAVASVWNPVPGRAWDRVSMCERARASSADYLLSVEYSETDGFVLLRFSLVDAVTEAVAAEADRSIKVDLSFDRVVTDAVRELLSPVRADLFREAPLVSSAQGQPIEAPPAGETVPVPEQQDVRDSGTALPTPAQPQTRSPTSEPREVRFRRLELAAGSAPFLPLGAAADYFKIGLYSSVSGVIRFNLGAARLGVGLEGGAALFDAQGASSAARTTLLPLGGLAALSLSYGGPLEVTFRLSGGAAVLSMRSDGVEPFAKLVPYAGGGVGLNVGLGPVFAVALDTRLAVFFEQAYGKLSPLLGLAPTVYLVLRL
jgi:hypothetical protein